MLVNILCSVVPQETFETSNPCVPTSLEGQGRREARQCLGQHLAGDGAPGALPLISLVKRTRCESVRGLGCSSMFRMSSTSHMNSITGWAL